MITYYENYESMNNVSWRDFFREEYFQKKYKWKKIKMKKYHVKMKAKERNVEKWDERRK